MRRFIGHTAGFALKRGGILSALVLVALCVSPRLAPADTIRNEFTGGANGITFADTAQVSLNRSSAVAEAIVAEIKPNRILVSSMRNQFTYTVMPTMMADHSGIRHIRILIPRGYRDVEIEGVRYGEARLRNKNPAQDPETYSATVSESLMTISFGSKVTVSGTPIEIRFRATAPDTAGFGTFSSIAGDHELAQSMTPGNADGEANNFNDFVVQVVKPQLAVLELEKEANRKYGIVGDVVTYTVLIRNTAEFEVVDVSLEDRFPAGFKLIEGSATLAGRRLIDPIGRRPALFRIGTVPAWDDVDGDGSIDPDEPGYLELRYQLVVGSGAMPGVYRNSVVAKDYCDSCLVSNEASAEVTITLDPDFDLSTIIGKVFEDQDSDGRQDDGELGIPGVMIALDNGTYAITDGDGRYHFPAVRPGQRMVKINLNSLATVASATNGESRVLWVTPGLMAKASFGVQYEGESVGIGKPAELGVSIRTDARNLPVDIVGSVETLSILVNGKRILLPNKNGLRTSPSSLGATRQIEGEGLHAETTSSAVRPDRDESVEAGEGYQYRVEVRSPDRITTENSGRSFGGDSKPTSILRLTGNAFDANLADLSETAKRALREGARFIRQHPDENFVIEGQTDRAGFAYHDPQNSRKMAEATAAYLTEVLEVPGDQISIRRYGESRTVAAGRTSENEEQDHPVVIQEELETPEASPQVSINDVALPIDELGRFTARIDDDGTDILEVEIARSGDRHVGGTIHLPHIGITSPRQEQRLAYGDSSRSFRIAASGSESPLVECRLKGRTNPGNRLLIDGVEIPVNSSGDFQALLPLSLGHNVCGILVENAQGASRIVNVDLLASDVDGDGNALIIAEAIPILTVDLPPPGVRLSTAHLRITGKTEPKNQVRANGQSLEVQEDGRFYGVVELPRGKSLLTVQVTDPEGRNGIIEREIDVARNELFLLAFAEGRIGEYIGRGHLEGTGVDDGRTFYVEGRAAFYLKGVIAGKYLVTSAFDSEKDRYEGIFRNIDLGKTERLLTNLDPDKLYPVYGDASSVTYDGESQGKFYLALESDEIGILVGNYPLSLSDTELAAYRRTLYGGQATYRSASKTRFGKPDTEIVFFGAELRQLHVRDELSGTGGSLYYLSHSDLIEGSEQVTLVVRDKITGLVLRRETQQQNFDYTIKYEEGRIMFRRPISSVEPDGDLVDREILSGDPIFIEVEYEVRADFFQENAFGARGRRQLGDRVSVGATYVDDQLESGQYLLEGADAEIRLGENSRIMAELAETEGTDSPTFVSSDGGLSYREVTPEGARQGRAWKAAAEIDLGEWIRKPDKYLIKAYLKELEAGFQSSGNFQERGTRKVGVSGELLLTDRSALRLRTDQEDLTADSLSAGTVARKTVGSVQWSHAADRWGFGAEYLRSISEDRDGNSLENNQFGAVKLSANANEKISGRVERQQTFSGPENDQTTLGLTYQLLPSLSLDAEGTEGTRGRSGRAGAALAIGDSRVYLTERVLNGGGDDQTSTVFGGESRFAKGSRIYSEYQWVNTRSGDRRVSLMGIQRQWEIGPGLKLLLGGETSQVDADSLSSERNALSGSIAYSDTRNIKASSRHEVRYENGIADRIQYFTVNQIDLKISPDFSFLGVYRFSKTRDRERDEDEARLEERTIGFAYRPVGHDRVNALARYSHLFDMRPGALAEMDRDEKRMDVVSVELVAEVHPRIEWFGKGAARIKNEKIEDRPDVTTHTYLGIQRINLGLWRELGLGVEYRVLHQEEAKDYRKGWLNEATWSLLKNFRLGMGYNFTDFSDNEYSMDDYSVRGWFMRLQGWY